MKAGTFSITNIGSIAICLNPAKGYIEVSCAAKGAQAFPFTALNVGIFVSNGQIGCQTFDSTLSDFPVDITPPSVTINQHNAVKTIDYDPQTGVGDASFIGYTGGHCNGPNFDSTGATEINHGTVHTSASENGNRVDAIVTALQDPVGGIGDFSINSVSRALVPTNP